jgi:hypothetical protein
VDPRPALPDRNDTPMPPSLAAVETWAIEGLERRRGDADVA